MAVEIWIYILRKEKKLYFVLIIEAITHFCALNIVVWLKIHIIKVFDSHNNSLYLQVVLEWKSSWFLDMIRCSCDGNLIFGKFFVYQSRISGIVDCLCYLRVFVICEFSRYFVLTSSVQGVYVSEFIYRLIARI